MRHATKTSTMGGHRIDPPGRWRTALCGLAALTTAGIIGCQMTHSDMEIARDSSEDSPEENELRRFLREPSSGDDGATRLAVIRQSNGNVIEFISHPELEELTLMESGPIASAGPVIADRVGEKLSFLEAYLELVPGEQAIPQDLVRYSSLDSKEKDRLIRGREIVPIIPAPVDVGDHRAAAAVAVQAACNSIGSGPYDWGPVYRESGCNADGDARYVKARICNRSNWGSIRMQLGHKPTVWSQHFTYWNSRTKDVGAGSYAYLAVDSIIKLRRRARYVHWDAYYEQAQVGGWYSSGSMTSNNCD